MCNACNGYDVNMRRVTDFLLEQFLHGYDQYMQYIIVDRQHKQVKMIFYGEMYSKHVLMNFS